MNERWLTYRLIIVLLCGICSRGGTLALFAQEATNDMAQLAHPLEQPVLKADTLATDSLERQNKQNLQRIESKADTARATLIIDSLSKPKGNAPKTAWVPNPQRALWLALVLPGAGQIYNRKYWKLPLLYGGFVGCVYAMRWNNQMYNDYSQAYLDIMDDDPNTKSYEAMLPPSYDVVVNEEKLKELFKRKKNYFRRYRDLSMFVMIGVYLLSVVDAYVDAELSVFDISPDLSFKIKPSIINNGGTRLKDNALGLSCHLDF